MSCTFQCPLASLLQPVASQLSKGRPLPSAALSQGKHGRAPWALSAKNHLRCSPRTADSTRALVWVLRAHNFDMSRGGIGKDRIRTIGKDRIRIAVVGDVHDYWDAQEDEKALDALQVDLVLFVGDIGNENVELVSTISQLNRPKAVILGNHDAWSTAGFFSGRPKLKGSVPDKVQAQLDALGGEHVGFGRLDFADLKLSIVGGRPFSQGGSDWSRTATFYKDRYNVGSFRESAQRIADAALAAPRDHTIVVLAHNGPTGLGSKPSDICGRDFPHRRGQPIIGGDHGDPDMEQALQLIKKCGRHVPLVIFGHMHHDLQQGLGARKKLCCKDDILYVNAANVPRLRTREGTIRKDKEVGNAPVTRLCICRHFMCIQLDREDRLVTRVEENWVIVEDKDVQTLKEVLL